MLRKSFSVEVTQTRNAEIDRVGKLKATDPALPMEIVINGKHDLKYLKFVYAATSNDSTSKVELTSGSTTVEIGRLNPYSTPYFWRLSSVSSDFVVRIFNRE